MTHEPFPMYIDHVDSLAHYNCPWDLVPYVYLHSLDDIANLQPTISLRHFFAVT